MQRVREGNVMLEDAKAFGRWVSLIEPCVYHSLDHWPDQLDHARQVLTYFDCPEPWHWPVIVMAWQGSYMGADEWIAQYAAGA